MTTFMTYKEECEALRQRVAELETQLAKNNPLLDEAADAIDKLTAERDELLAFVEEVRRTGDTRLASMAITAIASVKEKA